MPVLGSEFSYDFELPQHNDSILRGSRRDMVQGCGSEVKLFIHRFRYVDLLDFNKQVVHFSFYIIGFNN